MRFEEYLALFALGRLDQEGLRQAAMQAVEEGRESPHLAALAGTVADERSASECEAFWSRGLDELGVTVPGREEAGRLLRAHYAKLVASGTTEHLELTPLERAAVLALIDVAPEGRDVLKAQVEKCEVVSRDSNSHGFMVTLNVDRSLPPVVSRERLVCGIGANIPGLNAGAGFALWLEDGYAEALEGFAYVDFPNGEDCWTAVEQFELYRT